MTAAPVLSDLIAPTRASHATSRIFAREATLVAAGTALITLTGWVSLPLWFTPVPLSLATFGVLLTGAALGPLRAAASAALYLAAGVAGAPLFAGFNSGWRFASFGYILGYLLAVLAVGALARRRTDRKVLGAISTAIVGSACIYAVGVPWLMGFTGVDLATGLALGCVPFLIGDAIKAGLAAVVLPGTWALIHRYHPGYTR